MAKTVRVDLYGMYGEGKNKTEAKQDAAENLTAAMRGSYYPRWFEAGGYAVLIYRDPVCGICSTFLKDPDGWRSHQQGNSSGYDSMEDAERSVRRHLGSLSMDNNAVWGPADVPDIVKHEGDRRELWSDAAWHRAYRAAESDGVADPHEWACHHRLDFLHQQPVSV